MRWQDIMKEIVSASMTSSNHNGRRDTWYLKKTQSLRVARKATSGFFLSAIRCVIDVSLSERRRIIIDWRRIIT
jgi:hypothetical protein